MNTPREIMIRSLLSLICILTTTASLWLPANALADDPTATDTPNVILIMSDDQGWGDVGFNGFWTLEMFAVQPIRIYPGIDICQIFYYQVNGDIKEYCSAKYQNNVGIQPSLLYRELNPEAENEEDPQLTLGFTGNA